MSPPILICEEKEFQKYYSKRIVEAELDQENDGLRLTFEDGTVVRLWNGAQSCCELRYIVCDDDVKDLEGGLLREIQIKDGGDDTHEIVFIDILTNKTTVQLATHSIRDVTGAFNYL